MHVPEEVNALDLRVFVLEVEGGHLLRAAAIDHGDILGAEANGGVGSIDGGVAGADDSDTTGDTGGSAALVVGD